MKKQSERPEEASNQLRFELTCSAKELASPSSVLEAATNPPSASTSVILDLTPSLRRRAMEDDRALVRAVQARAAHLSDCLFKRL